MTWRPATLRRMEAARAGERERAEIARSGERDMTPAVGYPGSPASWRRAEPGAPVGLHQRNWRDAAWSNIFRRGTDYLSDAPADPARVEDANRRGRGGTPP